MLPSADNSVPAILGGPRAVTLPQDAANAWPIVGKEDERAVLDVLRSGQLSIHPCVAELEHDYRRWLGVRHAVAHCNGTSAIHAALHAFDLQPGDEVIVPSATWWASVMPVLHCGAIPVFAEVEPERLGLCPADVERRITPRTRAIVVVHLFGVPARIAELVDIARRHNLRLLEDASHAHGATVASQLLGTFGDAAVFSMQSNKLCPSAEGGMLVTDDDDLHRAAVRFGHYERLLPMTDSPDRRYAATGFGHKFRMSPLSAALARTQLRALPERNQRRTTNCESLSHSLEEIGIHTFLSPSGTQRVYFELLVHIDAARLGASAPVLATALRAEGCRVDAPRYPLLHQQPVFTDGSWARIARLPAADLAYSPDALPVTAALNSTLLKLPTFPQADPRLLEQYNTAFGKVLARA